MDETIVPKRRLGSTEIEVSALGWGTVKVGRNFLIKNKTPDGFDLPSEEKLKELLGICTEYEINLIDTAPAYGSSEERLGKLLKGLRKNFIINTKVGEEFDGLESTYDFSAEHIEKSIQRSLKRLQTDYLDSVLLHCPRNDLEVLQDTPVFEKLDQLKQAGIIRAYGASTHTVEGGIYAVENSDVVMIPFNSSYQEHLPVIQAANQKDRGILIKKGLMSGHIDEIKKTEVLTQCFRSALEHKSVASLIAGTINPEHLSQNYLCMTNSLK